MKLDSPCNQYFQLRDDMGVPGRWVLGDPLGEDNQEVTSWPFGEGRVLDERSPLRLQQVQPDMHSISA
jgi:hypothetical protein